MLAETRRFQVRACSDRRRIAALMLEHPEATRRLFASDSNVPRNGIVSLLERSRLVMEIERRATGGIAGVVMMTTYDPRPNHCFVSCLSFREPDVAHDMFFEGVVGAFAALYDNVGVQRIRFDVLSFNLPALSSVVRLCTNEGVRRDWAFVDGRYADAYLFSLSRIEWNERLSSLATRLGVRTTAEG